MAKNSELSVPEVARKLGFTLKYVYDCVYSGKFEAAKIDGRWRIPTSVVEEMLRRREERQ